MVSESPAVCWLCLCTQSKGQSHFQVLPTPLIFDCSLAPQSRVTVVGTEISPYEMGQLLKTLMHHQLTSMGFTPRLDISNMPKTKTNLYVTLVCMLSCGDFSSCIIEKIPAFITTAFTTVSLRFHISEVNRLVIVGYLDIKGDKGLRCQRLLSCEFKACHHVSLMCGLISGCQI